MNEGLAHLASEGGSSLRSLRVLQSEGGYLGSSSRLPCFWVWEECYSNILQASLSLWSLQSGHFRAAWQLWAQPKGMPPKREARRKLWPPTSSFRSQTTLLLESSFYYIFGSSFLLLDSLVELWDLPFLPLCFMHSISVLSFLGGFTVLVH